MLDRLEDRLLLSADGSFPPAVDTNQDGLFEPFDALILLNAVNHHTSADDAPQLDLNGDGQLSTADVDLIIGSLNSYYGGDWDADSIAALDDSRVSITDVTVAEGETAEVTVSLAQSVSEWTEVMVWSENGTATEYDDFTSTYTYLSFYPGEPLSQTVSIPTLVDGADEGDAVFFVRASGSWQTGFEAIGTVIVQDTAFILPTMSVGDVTVTEGESATITLTFDSAPATELFVTFWTTEGSAIMYEDYEGLSTDFYWYPGDPLSKTVTLHTYTDSHSEGDETLTVHADIRPSAGSVTPVESTATVTILDDGTGGSGGPTITVGDATVDEGNPAELTVSVSGPVTESIYLHAWASPGTADTSDYGNVSPTTFSFDPGGPTTYLVTVPTIADGIAESDETFTVHIENQSTYQGPTATVTILDPDGGDGGGGTTPGFSVSDVTVVEGDMAIVTVTLDAAPTSPLYLDAYTQSVTAFEAEDYDYTTAYLTFQPGDPLTQIFTIPTHGDNRNEGDETFEVIVSDNATYQSVTSTVTIQDVAPPSINVSGDTVSEGDVATVTVSLSAAPAAPLYLYVSSQSGTATEYEDYEYVGSYLTFHPGDPLTQTVEIQTHGDNAAEDDETFEVVVSNSETYESFTAVVTIQDNPPLSVDTFQFERMDEATGQYAVATDINEGDTIRLAARASRPVYDSGLPVRLHLQADVDFDGQIDALTETWQVNVDAAGWARTPSVQIVDDGPAPGNQTPSDDLPGSAVPLDAGGLTVEAMGQSKVLTVKNVSPVIASSGFAWSTFAEDPGPEDGVPAEDTKKDSSDRNFLRHHYVKVSVNVSDPGTLDQITTATLQAGVPLDQITINGSAPGSPASANGTVTITARYAEERFSKPDRHTPTLSTITNVLGTPQTLEALRAGLSQITVGVTDDDTGNHQLGFTPTPNACVSTGPAEDRSPAAQPGASSMEKVIRFPVEDSGACSVVVFMQGQAFENKNSELPVTYRFASGPVNGDDHHYADLREQVIDSGDNVAAWADYHVTRGDGFVEITDNPHLSGAATSGVFNMTFQAVLFQRETAQANIQIAYRDNDGNSFASKPFSSAYDKAVFFEQQSFLVSNPVGYYPTTPSGVVIDGVQYTNPTPADGVIGINGDLATIFYAAKFQI